MWIAQPPTSHPPNWGLSLRDSVNSDYSYYEYSESSGNAVASGERRWHNQETRLRIETGQDFLGLSSSISIGGGASGYLTPS